jgi:hypothetical protein
MTSPLSPLPSELVSVRRGPFRSVMLSFLVEGELTTLLVSHDDARALVECTALICDRCDGRPDGEGGAS